MAVTKENRMHYCHQYVSYFLNDAIKEQFKAFREGFLRVCSGKVLVSSTHTARAGGHGWVGVKMVEG